MPTPKRASAASGGTLWHRIGRGSLYVIAGCLPWFFLPFTGNPAGSARFFLVAVAATVGLVALLIDTVNRRKLTYPGSLASLGVLAVVVMTALSAIFSQATGISLFGGLVAPDTFAQVLIAGVVFVLASAFVTERVEHVRLLGAFLGGAALAGLLAVLGLLGVSALVPFAPTAVSGSGFIAVLALGITCMFPLRSLPSRAQVLLLGSGALSLGVLVLMNYRVLWVGVALIALFAAATGFVRKASIALPLGLSLLALVFVLVGARMPALAQPGIEVRPGYTVTASTARHTLASSRALIGTGPGTFGYAFAQHRTPDLNATPFWNTRFDQGASYLTTVPVTTGILGTLAWMLLLVGGIMLVRTPTTDPAGPFVVLAVLLSGVALLLYPGSFMQIVFGALGLGLLVGLAGKRRSLSFPGTSSWPLFGVFLALIVVTAASVAGLYLVSLRYVAATSFADGVTALRSGDGQRGITDIARAATLDPGSDAYRRALSQALLTQIKQQSASSTDQQGLQAMLATVLDSARAATALNPADPDNWGNLGGIFEGLTPYAEGADVQAIGAYDEAAKRDPANPVWPLAKARTYAALASYLAQQDKGTADAYAQAQEQLAAALTLKPDFADARFLSAQLYLQAGDEKHALERVTAVRELASQDPQLSLQLGLMLYQNARYEDARTDFEHAVSLNPGFSDARYFLGLTYAKLGKKDAAIGQFQELAKANPDNQEVPKIIANLEAGRPVLEGIMQAAPAATSTTP